MNDIVAAYKDAVRRILAELDRLDVADLSRANAAAALAEVARILAALDEESAAWVEANVPAVARYGVAEALVALGAASTVAEAERIAKFNRMNSNMIAAAISDTQADLLAVTQNIDRRVKTAVRKAVADSMRANMAAGINGRRTISREILAQIKRDLGTSVNTGIIDAAGRRWKPEVYVDMVTRTKLAEVQREATINEAVQRKAYYGVISRHGATDACAKWEGRVIKLVLEAPGDYPYFGDLPRREIFHPCCRHMISPVRRPAQLSERS